MTIASAPGKVIISGEHSVVYGQPALAGALNLRCTAQLQNADKGLVIHAKDLNADLIYSPDDLQAVTQQQPVHQGFDNLAGAVLSVQDPNDIAYSVSISSEIPIGAGLGSSAATSVAIVAALRAHLDQPFDKQDISDLAFRAEKIAHGTPSGIDNTVASLGGLVHFQAGESRSISLDHEIPLIIANSNIPRNTKELVMRVRQRKNTIGPFMDDLLQHMGDLTQMIESSLLDSDLERAGQLFDINHGLLDAIGVNHPKLAQLVTMAREAGAKGAKLTGAGGGGCMIALVDESSKDIVRAAMNLPGVDIYQTSISGRGVELR